MYEFFNRSLYFCLKIIWWNIRLLVLIEEVRELLTGLILQCVTDLFCHCSFSCLIMSLMLHLSMKSWFIGENCIMNAVVRVRLIKLIHLNCLSWCSSEVPYLLSHTTHLKSLDHVLKCVKFFNICLIVTMF